MPVDDPSADQNSDAPGRLPADPEPLPAEPTTSPESAGVDDLHDIPASLPAVTEGVIPGAPPSEHGAIIAPPRPPHPGFGWALVWCLAYLIVSVGAGLVTVIVAIFFQAVRSEDPMAYVNHLMDAAVAQQRAAEDAGERKLYDFQMTPEWADILAPAMFGAHLVALIFTLLVIRVVVGRDWVRLLALGRPSLGQVTLVFLGLPGLLILPTGVSELARQFLPDLEVQKDIGQLFESLGFGLSIFVIGVCPGLIEELWCRGFLGRGLVGHYGWAPGILLTSLCFGLLHMDPPIVVGTAFMGLFLHLVYLASRSLWMPILLHFLNNSSAVILEGQPELRQVARGLEHAPWHLYVAAVLLVVVVGWALYRGRTHVVPAPGTTTAWQPPYPSVEYPPPDSGMVLVRPMSGWLAWAAVALAVALFATSFYFSQAG